MTEILDMVKKVIDDVMFFIQEIYNKIVALFGEEE